MEKLVGKGPQHVVAPLDSSCASPLSESDPTPSNQWSNQLSNPIPSFALHPYPTGSSSSSTMELIGALLFVFIIVRFNSIDDLNLTSRLFSQLRIWIPPQDADVDRIKVSSYEMYKGHTW